MTARAGDRGAGKRKAAKVCRTCHDISGVGTNPMIANLAGQKELYLIKQLKDFRAGRRQHQQMDIIAKTLTDADIENLAAWYAGIRVTIQAPH